MCLCVNLLGTRHEHTWPGTLLTVSHFRLRINFSTARCARVHTKCQHTQHYAYILHMQPCTESCHAVMQRVAETLCAQEANKPTNTITNRFFTEHTATAPRA